MPDHITFLAKAISAPLHRAFNRLLQSRLPRNRDYVATHAQLRAYPDCAAARDLLGRMADIAREDPAYARQLRGWLKNGSTLEIRDLALPFGEYLKDRDLRNLVNFIDSARYYRFRPLT